MLGLLGVLGLGIPGPVLEAKVHVSLRTLIEATEEP